MSGDAIALDSPQSTHARSPSPASFRQPTPEIPQSGQGQPASSSFSTSWPVAESPRYAAYISASSSPTPRSRFPSVSEGSAEPQGAKGNQTLTSTRCPASPRPHSTERSNETLATVADVSENMLSTSPKAGELGFRAWNTLELPPPPPPPPPPQPQQQQQQQQQQYQPPPPQPIAKVEMNRSAYNTRLSISTTSSRSSGRDSIMSTATTMSSLSAQSDMSSLPIPPTKTDNRGTSKPQGPYWCTFCDVAFQRMFDWKRHEDEFHERYKSYPCPNCNRVFQGANTFNQHHKNAHGCTSCPHADYFVVFTMRKVVWACGFCGGVCVSRDRYFDHVARHYENGCNKTHWNHSLVIYGLLHQPGGINAARKEFMAAKFGHLPRDQQPKLEWDIKLTGHAQGFMEGKSPGKLQDLLEFFDPDRDDARFLVNLALDSAIQHQRPVAPVSEPPAMPVSRRVSEPPKSAKAMPGVLTPLPSLHPSPDFGFSRSNINEPYLGFVQPHPAQSGPVISNMKRPDAPLMTPPPSGMDFGRSMPPILPSYGPHLSAAPGHRIPQRPLRCGLCFPCGSCDESFSRKDALKVRRLPNGFCIANSHTRDTAWLKVAASQQEPPKMWMGCCLLCRLYYLIHRELAVVKMRGGNQHPSPNRRVSHTNLGPPPRALKAIYHHSLSPSSNRPRLPTRSQGPNSNHHRQRPREVTTRTAQARQKVN
jgi:hypothetical protein